MLELSDRPLPRHPADPDTAWQATERAWAAALPKLGASLAPADSQHSYAVLTGLTSRSGGMVAAATMSLPERSQAGRNYDYRYVWIRDQCYTGQAVAADGPHRLLDDAVASWPSGCWPTGRSSSRPTRCAAARCRTSVRCAPWPATRVARTRPETGSTGSSSWTRWAARCSCSPPRPGYDHLDTGHWRAAEAAVRAIETRWRDPDAGMWELDNHHWAQSRLMCVAGLRAIAAAGAAPAQAAAWQTLADTILADVAADSVHPSGRWQRAPDDERVDAALLLAAIRDAVPAGTRAAWPPCGRSPTTWPATATCTGSGTTSARCSRPRARSCCAGS